MNLFRVIASILHLGNITLQAERDDGAVLTAQAASVAEKVCHVMGISVTEFTRCLLKPKVKAGRDWVTQTKNVEQVYYSIEALARSLYERMFGELIDRINKTLYTPAQKGLFIGVLDIAGFEIFEKNSFEQLCINYTNEKLQQFFNHHMFILEQEEYKREGIEWKFIDFGLDLQPCIDLIEKTNPIGILSLLDEECVMPKASDRTFIDKLNGIWKGKSTKYDAPPRLNGAFILQHYAGNVEYNVTGWLDKNKDPLNENITQLLAASSVHYIAELFADSGVEPEDAPGKPRGIIKKGIFRTVSQRHKEGLGNLMTQLYSTTPHFVRCIIPNEEKKPGKIDANLVLDQLKCNGVLEGLRICRAGFPNRVTFQDFKNRYDILCPGVIPAGYIDGRKASQLLLDHLSLDKNQFRIGATKIFFRAGVLAELENRRDVQLSKIVIKCQALIRGYLCRKHHRRRLDQSRAIRIIQKNARIYVTLREWSWWRLYVKVKPLLNVTRNDEELKKKEALLKEWEEKARKEAEEKAKIDAARAALELEKKRIEDLLVQEQRAALDMNEILTRTQQREVDLNDRLKEIIAALEEREAQNDQLNSNKKRLETELRELRSQNLADSGNLDRLEKDRIAKDQKLKDIEYELQSEVERIQKVENDKRALEAEVNNLKGNLDAASDSQSELLKLKAKMQQRITELEQSLESEQDEKKKIDSRRQALEQELNANKNSIHALEQVKSEIETSLRRRDSEVRNLSESYKQENVEKDLVDKQRRELQISLQTTQEELTNEKNEREKLNRQKKKVEDELASLHEIVQQKGNEESKNVEVRKLRDQEINNYKSQLITLQDELEDTRKKGNITAVKLGSELDEVRQEISILNRSKLTLEEQLKNEKVEFERKEESCSALERVKRQVENDSELLKARVSELEANLLESKAQRDVFEKQASQSNSQLEQSQLNVNRLDREKQSIQRTVDQVREELDNELRKIQAVELQKKRLTVEIADLQARVEEDEISKAESQRKLSLKSSEFDELKEKYNRDVSERTAELEESRKRIEQSLVEVTSRFDDSERNNANLDKTKSRLNAEIEDLKLEIDREHNVTRNAERLLKQVEGQLNLTNLNLENERRVRETTESNARKLQANLDSVNLLMDEKVTQIGAIQKSKGELESELKALINEIGDGGKNLHDLEKSKRRLEQQVAELTGQVEEEEGHRLLAESAKSVLEIQFAEYRKNAEQELIAKDTLAEETRRLLMKEVNALGEQYDNAVAQKNDTLKAKKALEDQVNQITSAAESSAKGQSELLKLKNRNENVLKDLQGKLDEAERNRENFQELSLRHEKKANSLQADIERLELFNDSLERAKKQLEKQVSDLDHELNYGDDSKSALQEVKRKLLAENAALKDQIEDIEEEKQALLQNAKSSVNTDKSFQSATLLEYEGKLSKLEESRRALLAAQRLSTQELEDSSSSLMAAEKAKKVLAADLDEIKLRLEAEIVSKGEESATRRKLVSELKEMQLRFDAEVQKSSDLSDLVSVLKARADLNAETLEAAELGRIKAEKTESILKLRIKELEDQLDESNKSRFVALGQVKQLEERTIDLQDKLEDNSHELAELQIAKRKFQDELVQLTERYKADNDEREVCEDEARKKYQKEIKQLLSDLDVEKTTTISFKETIHDHEVEIENLTVKYDAELRAAVNWKREKEKLDQRIETLAQQLEQSAHIAEESNLKANTLSALLRETKANFEEVEAQRSLAERGRKALEQKIDEMESESTQSAKLKSDFMKSNLQLDRQTNDLKELVEEYQVQSRLTEDRVRRAESHVSDVQAELVKERNVNIELEKAKLLLEKSLKESNARIMDLESTTISRDTNTAKRLEARLEELALQLEIEQRDKSEALKNMRKNDRALREMSFQVSERDKAKARFEEEQEKADKKMRLMKLQLDELV